MCSESRDIPAMTREFMEHYYQGDVDWLDAVTTDDFVCIAAQSGQFLMSKAEVLLLCRDIPHVLMSNPVYRLSAESGGVYVVDGRFLGFVDPSDGMAFAAEQRLTALWRETDQGLRMFHIHVSNPMEEPETGERFPVKFAKKAMRYIDLLSQQKYYLNQIELTDIDGVHHMLRLFDVISVEAKRQDVLVRFAYTTIRVHEGIAKLADRIGLSADNGFVQVHRSFWVNVLYVQSVDGENAHLVTGELIPIAQRRRREIIASIQASRSMDRSAFAAAMAMESEISEEQ